MLKDGLFLKVRYYPRSKWITFRYSIQGVKDTFRYSRVICPSAFILARDPVETLVGLVDRIQAEAEAEQKAKESKC